MTHYDEKFFDWQKKIGEFGATVDLFKFRKYVKTTDRVVDFGCSGASYLRRLVVPLT